MQNSEGVLAVESNFILTLYEKYYNYLYHIVKNELYIRDNGEIESCVHQVFLIAIEKEEGLKQKENPKLWLAQTARYICYNYNRGLHLQLRQNSEDLESLLYAVDSTDIEAEVIENIRLKQYITLLKEQLTEDECRMIQLKYKYRLSMEEMGELFCVNSVCMNARTQRLKGKVKKILNNSSET